ncbi:type II secretion system secretin GspD [Permianibacter sp. IMCC34836]|uniref:type II secretion system secretin GspD n=1 Tax=Permianibacter fluminis TaxID=2738515 RepID=UPI0015541A4B|nr:type II secretion system secretin GspD [Permianibacter fluminis]NQD35661.1 type II secretion system secretin GspD [Permianibacter fluminis]
MKRLSNSQSSSQTDARIRGSIFRYPGLRYPGFRHTVLASALAVGLTGSALFAPSADAGQAILNLKDADIRVVIEQVSKLTGKTFVLDPRVQGQKITILSQHMMDEREIYDTFLTILKVYGFAAVETNGVTKIVQEQTARQDSVPVASEGGRRYRGDEMITRVIKVEHVDANQLVPVLRVLVPQQGHMAPYARTNVLVINDTAANIERLVEIIRQIDKASEEEIEIIQLKHAAAEEIVRILENLERQGAKAEDPINKPRYTADVRTNSILLSAEGKARLKLRGMIAQLDQPVTSGGNTKVIYLHYAKAEDVVKVLTGVSQQLAKQEEGKKSEGGSSSASRGRNGENFSIDSHEETNALVITAPPDMMRSLEAVIRQLDIRRAQVHVEAMIVEISDNKAKELGVQWLFADRSDNATRPLGVINYTNTGPGIGSIAGAALQQQGQDGTTVTTVDGTTVTTTTTPNNGDNGAALGTLLGSMQGMGLGLGRISDNGFSFGAFIRALGSTTDSNVLSRPSVTTLDNEEAEFLAGQEVPIITGSTLGGNNQNPFQQVDRKEIGVKLKIKPQINEGDAVKLNIEQEVSSIAGTTGVDIITNKRSIKNSVLVEDGDTIVLGGLVDDDVQQSVQKVPILGDIPLLGNLFKSQKTTKTKRNLLVFIRPTIIRDAESMSQLSARKYDNLRQLQIEKKDDGINLMPLEDPAIMPEWENRPAPVLRPSDMKPEDAALIPPATPAANTPAAPAAPAPTAAPAPVGMPAPEDVQPVDETPLKPKESEER